MGRLYLFTGKGGVGKTLSALSFAHHLIQTGRKTILVDFEAGEQDKLCQKLSIPHKRLELFQSFEEYIALKLKSKTLAKWIVQSEFFKSLIRMVPGMSYLVYLGHIIFLLKADDELTVVLDSPSSGHALMMLESLSNYAQIFLSGLFFNDIQMIQKFIRRPNALRILICHIPTSLSLSEGAELKKHLEKLKFDNIQMVLNFSLTLTLGNFVEELPPYLKERIRLEEELEQKYDEVKVKLPYIASSDHLTKVECISSHFKDFI